MPGLGPGGRRFESFHPDKRGGKIASPLSCERIQGLLLFCFAKALHFITLGGPLGPLSLLLSLASILLSLSFFVKDSCRDERIRTGGSVSPSFLLLFCYAKALLSVAWRPTRPLSLGVSLAPIRYFDCIIILRLPFFGGSAYLVVTLRAKVDAIKFIYEKDYYFICC